MIAMTQKFSSLFKKRDLRKDESGISAVEFALIAPLMAVIYFGCIELSMMMTLDRKVTSAAAALGDLTARASEITDEDLSDIFEATRMVMQPNDMSVAKMRISSLREDSGTVKVDWSDACSGGSGSFLPYAVDSTKTIPPNLIPVGGTLVMAEIEYPFNSAIGFFFSSEKTLSDTFYLRPRRVDSITRDNSLGSVTCGF